MNTPTLRAVTLVELITSTLLIAIILAGVFSADFALRRMDKNISVDAQVYAQTRAVAENIRMAIRKNHGDLQNTGITIDAPASILCIRYDVKASGDFTPHLYTDDNYSCFQQRSSTFDLYRCDDLSPSGALNCSAGGVYVGALVSFTAGETKDSITGAYYIDIAVTGRKDPSTAASATDNPEAVVTIRENAGGF